MNELVVVGGGRMGEALVRGVLRSGRDPGGVVIVEVDPTRRDVLGQLAFSYPGLKVTDSTPAGADGAVIAVKPADVETACAGLRVAKPRRILSIAAGVPLTRLEGWLGQVPIVRAMPNTPALVGAGVAAVASGRWAGEQDLAWAEAVLGAVGSVVRVPERALDAVTGLSGSGPAYVFVVAEALIDAGVAAGLPRDVSATLALRTIHGAGRLLVEGNEPPEALRAAVTSPGGTTAAGLRVLEQRAVRAAFIDAVLAATARSRELGRA